LAGAVLAGAVFLAVGAFLVVVTAFFVGVDAFLAGAAGFFLATATARTGESFLVVATFFAATVRDAGAFFAAAPLLAGVIVSSFPTAKCGRSPASTAPRERVTIADRLHRGNTARARLRD
jgi:hypothetical protein